MAQEISARFFHDRRKYKRFCLAFAWIVGCISGIVLSLLAGNSLVSWMRGVVWLPVSIVGLLLVTYLPFLCSAFVVLLGKPALLLLICFCKAVLFMVVSFLVSQAFLSGGWLIRAMLMFTDCMSAPVLYFFWLRCVSGKGRTHFLDGLLCFAVVFLIVAVDYRIVSPFLAGFLN